MKCDEFKQAAMAEPSAETPARQAHTEACPECAGLLRKLLRMDRQLSALMAVPVPESMKGDVPDMAALDQADDGAAADDTVVAFRGRETAPRRFGVPAWAGLAAAVALAAIIVLRPPATETVDGEALVAELIEHLAPELTYMRASTDAVGDDMLTAALQPAGVSLDRAQTPGLVSYAKHCIIDGKSVPHLVVQGEHGPVTVLILPDQHVDGPMSIMQDGLEGVLLPVGDGGSIAIIGRDAASVEAVRSMADGSLNFST